MLFRSQSKGGPRGRQANPKVLGIVAGVVALVAVAIVLGFVFTRGSSKASSVKAVGNATTGLPGSSDVEQMFKGIPQSGTTLGSAFAPVTMVEYIDLQCPICQEFETQVMPDIIDKYVRTKKVKVVVRPWAFIGSDSFRGQAAMLAAAKQNKGFNYAQVLYNNQGTENTGWLNDNMVTQAAESVTGLKVPLLLSQRSSSQVKQQAQTVAAQAQADGVTGTPSIFVGKSGAKPSYVPLQSGTDSATLVSALNQALGR